MKKRVFSLLLALTMLLGMLPLSAQAVESSVGTALPSMVDVATNVAWSATTSDGRIITQNTYKGKTQVLIFFSITGKCDNSNKTFKALMQSDLLNNDKVQIIAIGCSATYKNEAGNQVDVIASADTLQKCMNEHGLRTQGNLVFAWSAATSQATSGYFSAVGAEAKQFAMNVILDSAGHLRTAWFGDYEADYYASVLSMLSETGVTGDTEGYKTYKTTVTGISDYAAAYQELAQLNAYRAQNGFSTLKMDADLLEGAMQRAAELAIYYSHTRPDYTSCFTVITGNGTPAKRENIAIGYTSVDAVMTGWEHSPGHNENILGADNRSVGIGCFTASNGVKHWVQLFSSSAGTEEQTKTSGAKTVTRNVVVAAHMLDLGVSPTSATIKAGNTASFTLTNLNQEFGSQFVIIGVTSASTEDSSVAKATINSDGTVTVTAIGGGQTKLKLGLMSSGNGAAKTIDVPVTVEATALTRAMFTVNTAAETYDGTAKTKTVTGGSLRENVDYTVSYQNNTNAGTAKIVIAGKGLYSGSLEYTFPIQKANRTLAATAAKTQLYVGGSAAKISVTDNASSPTYTYTSSNSSVVTVDRGGNVTPVGVGTATVTVAASATANYQESSASVNFTVTALPQQQLAFTAAGPVEKVYGDGKFTNAAANATQGGGAVTYASSDHKIATVNATSGEVTVIGVGTATITATAAGVAGKYAETSASYTVKVSAKPLSVQSVTIEGKTYDGTTTAKVDTVTIGGLVNGDTLTAGVDYTVTATFTDAKAGENKPVTGTVTLAASIGNYTLRDGSFTTTGNIAKARFTLPKNLLMKAEENYKRTVDLGELVGLPKGETFTFTVADGSYTGLSGAACGTGDKASVLTVTAGDGATYNVTDDAITLSAVSDNYEGTITIRVTYIDKTPVSVSGITVADKVYDGKAATYTVTKDVTILDAADGTNVTEMVQTACGGAGGVICATDWYRADDLDNALDTAPKDAGNYIMVGTVNTAEHYGTVEIPFAIRKAAITVTADDKQAYAGEEQPAYTYTISGLVAGEKLATAPTAACPTADMALAGSYPIVVSGGVAPAGGNYEDIVYVPGTLTVFARSSGGSGATTSHVVAVSTVSNGTVSVSPKGASKGTTVTITVKPDLGYEVSKVTVTDQKGNVVALTDKGDGKYTFTMPDSQVSIKAEFVEIEGTQEQPIQTVEIDKIFSDINAGDWYADAVAYVYARGIMVGMGDGIFAPAAATTRGTIVTMLYRLEGEPPVIPASFADVPAREWYTDSVAWAFSSGIVKGYGNGYFGPKDDITREQMAAILYRYASWKGYDVSARADLSGFIDEMEVGSYARDAMAWANAVGLINGTSVATLSPLGTSTRAQIATMLMRFCEKVVK